MPRRLLVGNWKMHGTRADLAELRAIELAARSAGLDTVLCPPSSLIAAAGAHVSYVAIGAQDCHAAPHGPHTGCISAAMLADAGARWVILGHSEVRTATRADDVAIAAKLSAAQALLRPILCVGEAERGDSTTIVAGQLLASLPADADPACLVVAYEPVWAIGSGQTPALSEIAGAHAALRMALIDRFGAVGADISILYGGSVGPANAGAIVDTQGVDGLLVGGASLRAATFVPIIEAMAIRGGDECVAA